MPQLESPPGSWEDSPGSIMRSASLPQSQTKGYIWPKACRSAQGLGGWGRGTASRPLCPSSSRMEGLEEGLGSREGTQALVLAVRDPGALPI